MTPVLTPCAACRFWQASSATRAKMDASGRPVATVRLGHCHRRAPAIGHNGGGRLFPETDERDGCWEGAR